MIKCESVRSEPIILGVDPGTLVSGYGLITIKNGTFVPIDFGCIRPPTKYKLSDRYLVIYNSLEELIAKYRPNALAVETQYVQKNIQSAIKLGMARGVMIVAAKKQNVPIFEYAPTQAKKAVVGKGSASKHQVQSMVQFLLRLASPPQPHDAADALALAICHGHALMGFSTIKEI